MSTHTNAEGLRVILADDSLLIRDGLVRILREQGVDVLGVAGTESEAITLVRSTRPDVAILDMRMPPSYTNEGILVAEAIRRSVPATGILVLAQDAERAHVQRLLDGMHRGVGYMLKDRVTDWQQLAEALVRVANGGTAIDPVVVEMLLRQRIMPAGGALANLTDREHAVLALMAEGLTNKGIADRMTISVRTVESHVNSVFLKLALAPDDIEHRRVVAVLEFLRLRVEPVAH